MPHALFKRYFIIVAACILLVGAFVPLVVHSASSAHAASTTQQGEPKIHTLKTVPIKNRCGPQGLGFTFEGPQTIATLNQGQEIDITAKVTGDDGNVEQEALSIYAKGQPSIQLILANSGPNTFEFNATDPGVTTVVACFVLIRYDDEQGGDFTASDFFTYHTATVKYEVETGS
jgi:hypothetical protein